MESLCYLIVGSMCFMSGSVEMENAYLPENEVGIWQWLFGKTITSIVLCNSGPSDGFVGIAAPYFARILPVCTGMIHICILELTFVFCCLLCVCASIKSRVRCYMLHF